MSKYTTISFKLIKGRDDDLIKWIQELKEENAASFIIRQALRKYKDNQVEVYVETTEKIDEDLYGYSIENEKEYPEIEIIEEKIDKMEF